MNQKFGHPLPFDDEEDEFGFDEGYSELASDLREYADEDDGEFDGLQLPAVIATVSPLQPTNLPPPPPASNRSAAKKEGAALNTKRAPGGRPFFLKQSPCELLARNRLANCLPAALEQFQQRLRILLRRTGRALAGKSCRRRAFSVASADGDELHQFQRHLITIILLTRFRLGCFFVCHNSRLD